MSRSQQRRDEKDGERRARRRTAVAARMLDFQIKSCRHLDKILASMRDLLKYNRAYKFNASFDGLSLANFLFKGSEE